MDISTNKTANEHKALIYFGDLLFWKAFFFLQFIALSLFAGGVFSLGPGVMFAHYLFPATDHHPQAEAEGEPSREQGWWRGSEL